MWNVSTMFEGGTGEQIRREYVHLRIDDLGIIVESQ